MRPLPLCLFLLLAPGCRSEPPAPPVADDDDDSGDDDDSALSGDADGDGWTVEEGDCDDDDPSVSPGAVERCDPLQRDEDCDGLADLQDPEGAEGSFPVWPDVDGDGYGRDGTPTTVCSQPPGSSLVDGDCDDLQPRTWLGAPRICDGEDNDCDGVVSDGGLVTVTSTGFTSTSIQTAWDAAFPGGTVHVCPGTYAESLVLGKPGVLLGLLGREVSLLDASGLGRGIEVTSESVQLSELSVLGGGADEGAGLRVSDVLSFTLIEVDLVGGAATGRGGGALFDGVATLNLQGLHVLNGSAAEGGGAAFVNCGGGVYDLIARANTAEIGGGIYVEGAAPLFEDALIEYNQATVRGGGGALLSATTVLDADLFDNQAPLGSAYWAGSALTLQDGSVLRNSSTAGGALHVVQEAFVTDISFGAGADDNTPADVSVEGGGGYPYGAFASFLCVGSGSSSGQPVGCQ